MEVSEWVPPQVLQCGDGLDEVVEFGDDFVGDASFQEFELLQPSVVVVLPRSASQSRCVSKPIPRELSDPAPPLGSKVF